MTEQNKASDSALGLRSVGVVWLAGCLALAPAAALAQTPALAPATSVEPASAPATSVDPASAPASAAPTALDQYRASVVELRPGMGGLNGFQLRVGGKDADIGFFGKDAPKVFGGSPEALAAADRFRTRRITGTALWGGGMGVLVATMVLTAAGSSIVFDKNDSGEFSGFQPSFYVLLLGGSVVGMAGGIMMQSAVSPLNEAVDAYNEHAYQQAKGPPSVRVNGTF